MCEIPSSVRSDTDDDDGDIGGRRQNPDALREGVLGFQRFVGIPETGELDEETRRWMEMPRYVYVML